MNKIEVIPLEFAVLLLSFIQFSLSFLELIGANFSVIFEHSNFPRTILIKNNNKIISRFFKTQENLHFVMAYFPPKNPSQRLVEATEALKAKGYGFSTDKKLCQIDPETDKLNEESGFVFEVKKGDQKFNQKNYEEIGDIITEYVYGLLESDPINLVRLEFPPDQGKHFTSSLYLILLPFQLFSISSR